MKIVHLTVLALLVCSIIYYLFNPAISSFYYVVFSIYGLERIIDFFKVLNNEL